MSLRNKTILIIVSLIGMSGCASIPHANAPIFDGRNGELSNPSDHSSATAQGFHGKGAEIFGIARGFLGTPYRYGGGDPSGFDCSGLVQYSHRNAGIRIPRTTTDQYAAARTINSKELKPGDVIFFRINRRKTSHVGIYAGNGQFIHAPNTGKRVSFSNLDDPYWQRRIVKTGRFY